MLLAVRDALLLQSSSLRSGSQYFAQPEANEAYKSPANNEGGVSTLAAEGGVQRLLREQRSPSMP